MQAHIDYEDPALAEAAREILRRHDEGAVEANITSAVRDFLVATELVKSEEVVEEVSPALGSRRAVDLAALDTFIEFKRRIGSTSGLDPNPEFVQQLDDYLAESQEGRRVRMGILTDGKHWLLRWPNAGPVKLVRPYAFTLEDPERWPLLYEWLRDNVLSAEVDVVPSRESIAKHFGPDSPHYERDIAAFKALYDRYADANTIRVKRELWEKLLTAALGEIAFTPDSMDGLFVRHTYLTAVVGMVVQASFGIDIYAMADAEPADLLHGRDFRSKTGLQGVVESDFFAWPTEVGGLPMLRTLARRVARFDWKSSPNDVAAILYETVIPPEERRQLGEYYTPDWLARAIVREVVTEPLGQYVLDPACGSGTFVAEAVTHLIEAAAKTSLDAKDTLEWLRFSVSGIDVHPVAVHLARAAWVLAAQPAIQAAVDSGFASSITVPIYLGDALQLRFRTGDMFAEYEVTVEVEDEQNTELVFPRRLVDRAEDFDALMGDIAEYIESGDDPCLALDDHHVTDPDERRSLEKTVDAMQRLHNEGRDHIWAYYTRNLVRPSIDLPQQGRRYRRQPAVAQIQQNGSVLSGLSLERQSRNATTASGLAASMLLFKMWLVCSSSAAWTCISERRRCDRDGHAPQCHLQGWTLLEVAHRSRGKRGQAAGEGIAHLAAHCSVDFGLQDPNGTSRSSKPNTFFPVPASVVFARYEGQGWWGDAPWRVKVERWHGETGYG